MASAGRSVRFLDYPISYIMQSRDFIKTALCSSYRSHFCTTEQRCRSDLAFVAVTSEEDNAATIIDKIVDRVVQQSVPAVEPQEQSVVPLAEATCK